MLSTFMVTPLIYIYLFKVLIYIYIRGVTVLVEKVDEALFIAAFEIRGKLGF